jgi:hypothetical protein
MNDEPRDRSAERRLRALIRMTIAVVFWPAHGSTVGLLHWSV